MSGTLHEKLHLDKAGNTLEHLGVQLSGASVSPESKTKYSELIHQVIYISWKIYYLNADIPVISCPKIRVCISNVPS